MYKVYSFKVIGFRFVTFLNYATALFDEHKFRVSSCAQHTEQCPESKMQKQLVFRHFQVYQSRQPIS